MAAAHTKDTTYLGARYQRLAPRLGKKKAIVALEHSILTAVWHMLTHDVDYRDLGGDYFTRRDPDRALNRIIRQANALDSPSASTPSRLPNHPANPPRQPVPPLRANPAQPGYHPLPDHQLSHLQNPVGLENAMQHSDLRSLWVAWS